MTAQLNGENDDNTNNFVSMQLRIPKPLAKLIDIDVAERGQVRTQMVVNWLWERVELKALLHKTIAKVDTTS